MKIIVTAQELIDNGSWEDFCEENRINPYAVNEGLMDSDQEITLTEDQAAMYGLIPKPW